MSSRLRVLIDGCEVDVVETSAYSVGIGRDLDGSLVVMENGVPVTDEARAVELYAAFAGAVGWSIMDAVEVMGAGPA